MKRSWIAAGVAVSLVSAVAARAEEAAPQAPEKPKAAREHKHKDKPAAQTQELTICGKITKTTKPAKEAGQPETVLYVLTDEAGNVVKLPKPGQKEGQPALNLDEYLDVSVKLTGKGVVKQDGEKKKIAIREIVSIEKVQ